MKIGLFGTCNNSTWRDEMIPFLKADGIDYFNPVVDDWNEDSIKEEEKQKSICDYLLFVITSEMVGVYSIAEIVDASYKYPNKCIFVCFESYKNKKFNSNCFHSLKATGNLLKNNNVDTFFYSSESDIITFILEIEILLEKKSNKIFNLLNKELEDIGKT